MFLPLPASPAAGAWGAGPGRRGWVMFWQHPWQYSWSSCRSRHYSGPPGWLRQLISSPFSAELHSVPSLGACQGAHSLRGPFSHTGYLGAKSVVQFTLQRPLRDQKEENLQPKCIMVISFLLLLCPTCHSASETTPPPPPANRNPCLWICVYGAQVETAPGISLVVQWIGIPMLVPGTRISIRGPGRSHLPWSNCAQAPWLLKAVCPRACDPQKKPEWWQASAPQWSLAPTHSNQKQPARSHEDPAQSEIN